MNTVTPRLFIAATEQDTGKTTMSLGLYAALSGLLGRIGYIKPVGQRFTEVDGRRIDDDSLLIEAVFNPRIPIEHMSPIAVEPDFTRRYINEANHDALVKRIRNSFDRACWEKDFTIIEGSGHAGVGAVFDLSNATVARLLGSKVLLVVPGGIGRPIDEGALNKALFELEGVEIVGVVMNKVLEDKIEYVTDFARRGFGRLELELLGVLPMQRLLAQPTLGQVAEKIRGEFYCNAAPSLVVEGEAMIGAVGSANLAARLGAGTLLIVPGDREDIVLAAIADAGASGGGKISGLVLSDGLMPHPNLLRMLAESGLPVVISPMDSYSIANRIHSMRIKLQPGDTEKIRRVQDLVAAHVDTPRLLAKLGLAA